METNKKISMQLSELLRKHTSKSEHIACASRNDVPYWKLKSVVFAESQLKDCKVAIQDLIKVAISNAEESSRDVELLKLLKK